MNSFPISTAQASGVSPVELTKFTLASISRRHITPYIYKMMNSIWQSKLVLILAAYHRGWKEMINFELIVSKVWSNTMHIIVTKFFLWQIFTTNFTIVWNLNQIWKTKSNTACLKFFSIILDLGNFAKLPHTRIFLFYHKKALDLKTWMISCIETYC